MGEIAVPQMADVAVQRGEAVEHADGSRVSAHRKMSRWCRYVLARTLQ